MRFRILAASLLLLVGCGGTEPGTVPNSSISAGEVALVPQTALFRLENDSELGRSSWIVVTDVQPACEVAKLTCQRDDVFSFDNVQLSLMAWDPGDALGAGTYEVVSGTWSGRKFARAELRQTAGGTTKSWLSEQGTLELTRVEPERIEGKYSLVLNGSPVSGTFSAVLCGRLQTLYDGCMSP